MYTPINGWTKKRIKEQLIKKNNGSRAGSKYSRTCYYRTPDGIHCGVGCFIPDGHKGMDEIGDARDLLDNFPDLVALMPLSVEALSDLQDVHDSCVEIDVREHMLQWVDDNVEDVG